MTRLAALDDTVDDTERTHAPSEAALERPMRPQERRIAAAVEVLRERGARRVYVGCGDGDLTLTLACEEKFEHVLATAVSVRELERAKAHLERASMRVDARAKVEFSQSSALYADRTFQATDAIALLEVVEHVDEARLPSLEKAIYGFAHPKTIVVTTPKSEYNIHFTNLRANSFRHPDQRFVSA